MDEVELRIRLLEQEIGHLQEVVRSQDGLVHQIKGWAITVALAAAGFAVSSGAHDVALLGVAATVGFWLIDAQRRTVQRRAIRRAVEIETYLGIVVTLVLVRVLA